MNTAYSDTISIDTSIQELPEVNSFEQECLKVLEDFLYIQNLLIVESTERIEIIEHKMATVTLYKDLFRVQLDKLLQVLLSQEISKLPDGNEKNLLLDVTLDNITNFLENDIYLDGTSITNTLKNIILNILKNINFVVNNWEFINVNAEKFEDYDIETINSAIEYMLTDNISTFLGENIKLANSFLNNASAQFEPQQLESLESLIKENGFRKIEFGYDLDFEKIKYLIYSAIRCKNQIANEREDTELFNLLTVLIINFKNNPGTLKIIEDVKELYSKKPDILRHLAKLIDLDITPRLIIENSPPIYTNVQHNLMYRIYESTDGGVKVHIFSVPYNRMEVESSIDRFKGIAEEILTFPTTGNQVENDILSTLIASNLDLEEAIATHPTINRIGIDTIRNNDSILDPIIEELMNKFKPFVVKVVKDLPQIIANPVTRAQFVKNYEDTIRAIDLHFKDKTKIKSNLSEEELETLQASVLKNVMNGQSLEAAVQEIVGNRDIELSTQSDGDCVQFETEIKSVENSNTNQDFSRYANGTVLSTKLIEENGFKSEITEMVVDGEKINLVRCLVCQKMFDTCNEYCPECKTSREMQYDAIYNGKKQDGKAAIKQINKLIKERQSQANIEMNRQVVNNSNGQVDSSVGGAIAGVFTGFLKIVSFGVLDDEPKYFEA